VAEEPEADLSVNEHGDDRNDIRPGDRVLLIVENDVGFARFELDAAREKGFKGLVTSLGAAGLALAREYNPAAIALDIHLPDIDGWRVIDRLKRDPATRHIPVAVVSTDDARDQAVEAGAAAFVAKPIPRREVLDGLLDHLNALAARPTRRLLVIDQNARQWDGAAERFGREVEVTTASDATRLSERPVDCVVVCPPWGDPPAELPPAGTANGVHTRLPVIVYADGVGVQAAEAAAAEWRRFGDSCLVRVADSPDALLDLTTFHLHAPLAALPEAERARLHSRGEADQRLAGKRVLIVDDDVRNIFALTTVLEEHDMVITSADNGRKAINMLLADPRVDVVLMDIMMPGMDGMETMREIRKIPDLKRVPIVAVTAKAMKGDREKCIEAGAWDYLSKPVEPEQLLAVLRAWTRR